MPLQWYRQLQWYLPTASRHSVAIEDLSCSSKNSPPARTSPTSSTSSSRFPRYGPGIKFEFEKASGALLVDRFLATPMHYPCNYGFIPHTLSLDGDPLDALVDDADAADPGHRDRVPPGRRARDRGRCGGRRKDPVRAAAADHARSTTHVQEVGDVPPMLVRQIEHFFSHYKDLEPGKWMTLKGWGDAAPAKRVIDGSGAALRGANPASSTSSGARTAARQGAALAGVAVRKRARLR